MSGNWFFRIVLAIVLIAMLVGAGVYIYNIGVVQGMAAEGNLPAPDGQAVPGPYPYPYAYGPFFRPWGFGFFPFGLIFPLFFFLLFFALLRGLFFRGWNGGGWYRGGPPDLEEWHRREHEKE